MQEKYIIHQKIGGERERERERAFYLMENYAQNGRVSDKFIVREC